MSQTTRSPNYLRAQQTNQPRPIHSNVITCLKTHDSWAGRLAYNQLSKRVIVRGCPWEFPAKTRAWTDQDDVMLIDWLARYEGLYIHTPKIVAQSVDAVARENGFHPVVQYLDGLEWDGEPRLDSWLGNYLGCPIDAVQSEQYLREVGRCALISAVARAYQPGCKVDTCLILEGNQGRYKSTAVKTLAGEWYTDDVGDIGTKDAALQIQTWIIELSELNAVRRAEAPHLKAFLSRQVDRFRPPYGQRVEEFPRPGIFIGTVNPSEYLIDDTGARRFWPVETGHIHVGWLAEDRDQLWAEARVRYQTGEPWWLEATARAELASPVEESRRLKDPWEDDILDFARGHILGGYKFVSLRDVLCVSLDFKPAQIDQKVSNRVASIFRANGWTKRQFRVGPKRVWGYCPAD